MKDKLELSDDFFKMALTIVTITLTIGTKLFVEWGERYLTLVGIYFVCLAVWGVGHLLRGTSEVLMKLWSWFFLIYLVPMSYASMMTIGTSAGLRFVPSQYAAVASFVSLVLYGLMYRYLRDLLEGNLLKRLLTWWFPAVTIITMLAANLVSNYFL